jgi:hypothetical protein
MIIITTTTTTIDLSSHYHHPPELKDCHWLATLIQIKVCKAKESSDMAFTHASKQI